MAATMTNCTDSVLPGNRPSTPEQGGDDGDDATTPGRSDRSSILAAGRAPDQPLRTPPPSNGRPGSKFITPATDW